SPQSVNFFTKGNHGKVIFTLPSDGVDRRQPFVVCKPPLIARNQQFVKAEPKDFFRSPFRSENGTCRRASLNPERHLGALLCLPFQDRPLIIKPFIMKIISKLMLALGVLLV